MLRLSYFSGMAGKKKPLTFKITMAPLVRIGYLGAISSTVFVLTRIKHPLTKRVLERELFDERALKRLKELKKRIEPAAENEKLEFTLEEYILLYTVIDLGCKLHVTALSEELQEINRESIAKSEVPYTEMRDVLLRYSEAFMRIMAERAGHVRAFKERMELLQEPFWLAGE